MSSETKTKKPRYVVQRQARYTETFEDVAGPFSTLYAAEQYKAEAELLHDNAVYAIRPTFGGAQ